MDAVTMMVVRPFMRLSSLSISAENNACNSAILGDAWVFCIQTFVCSLFVRSFGVQTSQCGSVSLK